MTKRDNQSMFLSITIPKGHFTCTVPWDGRLALTKFSNVYGSDMEVEDSRGILSDVTTPTQLNELVQPVYGEPLIIRYIKGGIAFLDYNDDALTLILPDECDAVLRLAIDVNKTYDEALHERTIWEKGSATSASIRKFDEILQYAIRR